MPDFAQQHRDEIRWAKLVDDLSALPPMKVGDIVTMQHFVKPKRYALTPDWRHIFYGGGCE
jgi:hypothetical protein